MAARTSTGTPRRTPDRRTAAATTRLFRPVIALVGCYAALSVLTLVAAALLQADSSLVSPAVWIRAGIVAATSLLMLVFVTRAARGSSRALLRLRLVSAIMVVAIAVILVIPGDFPLWLKIEQGVCGLLLIGVVAIINRPVFLSAVAGERASE